MSASDSRQGSNRKPEPGELSLVPEIRPVGFDAPLRWLGLGFTDLLRAPACSLFYGVVLAGMGYLFVTYYGGAIGLALSTGFLLIGPFLAVGIYEISRQLATASTVVFSETLVAWRANLPAIGFYALILMLSLAVWMRITVVLIALLVPGDVEGPSDLLALIIGAPGAWLFLLIYVGIGAALASFSFASSAVSLPMLLHHRELDAITAMITSFRAIRRNPWPMAAWAIIIVALTVAGFMSWFVGLVVVVPLIGHATWHAYRELVTIPAAPELRTPF